jgi:dephospho-CoA kinase
MNVRIGITGGIGSGKSFVCKQLHTRGIDVYDCDNAAKRLIRNSPDIRRQLSNLIGANIYTDGELNKPLMREFLLKSEDNARAIDQIVHPAVAEDFAASNYQWMECAILFESGFNRLVDYTVLVSAPLEVRINRMMNRDSISRKKAIEWIDRQWDENRIRQYCDFEIVNDGTADLNKQIDKLLDNIKQLINSKK